MTMDGRDPGSHEEEAEGGGSAVDFLLEWEEAGVPQCDDRLEPTREGGSYLTEAACEELSDGQAGFPLIPGRDEKPSWRRRGVFDEPEADAASDSAGRQTLPAAQSPSQREQDDREQADAGEAGAAAPGREPAGAAAGAMRQQAAGIEGVSASEGSVDGKPHTAASPEEKQLSEEPGTAAAGGAPAPTEAGKDGGGAEEFFQWTAERNKAIEEALSETREARLPTVHNQLEAIRRSLEKGEISGGRALELLGEVERYLGEKIEHQKSKVTVAHEAVIGARSDLLKGLYSYQESVNSLKEYVASKEDVQLHLSVYTADQATSFIAQAKHTIMEARPEEPEVSKS